MSAADSTDPGLQNLSPVELDAARGQLPEWARATPPRRAHMARVAALLEQWASELQLGQSEVLRWAAIGWLHDALRDADPRELRAVVRPEERELPGSILHGPAAAALLEGQVDQRCLRAIRYHTIGHPSLDRMGRALYLADFLEPGREFLPDWRVELRARMPGELDTVLMEVLATRIRHLLDSRKPISPETAAFWSQLATERLR
jgi:HD superfamily phosphohydrolase YqeK